MNNIYHLAAEDKDRFLKGWRQYLSRNRYGSKYYLSYTAWKYIVESDGITITIDNDDNIITINNPKCFGGYCADITPELKIFIDYIEDFFVNLRINTSYDINNNDIKKENDTMFKFDFGPVNTSTVHMSPYGLAIRNKAGDWVAYDKVSNSIMDVEVFNFEADRFLFKMPVALKDIASGDILIHNKYPMFVETVHDDNHITVIDIYTGENKIIVPTKSPFGFNFYTKVVNIMDMCGAMNASDSNPFGNMWMLAAMSDDDCDDNLLPMMMLANGNFGNGAMNPMMMYMLARNSSDNLLPLMFMMQGGSPFAQPASN